MRYISVFVVVSNCEQLEIHSVLTNRAINL